MRAPFAEQLEPRDEVTSLQGMLHASLGEALRAAGAAGIPVQWSIRPGRPHGIDPEGVEHGAAFLAAAFAAPGA